MTVSDKTKETLLEFPEKFPIKIFGLDNEEFTTSVRAIIDEHVAEADLISWKQQESSKGTYLALTVTITARSQEQLDNIYLGLTANQLVKMAL